MAQMNDITFLDVMDGMASRGRGLTFVSSEGDELITYSELRERTQLIGGGYLSMGIAPAERVMIVAGDHRDFALAFLGALWAGAVPVPVAPPHMVGSDAKYAESLRRIATASGAEVIVGDHRATRDASELGIPLQQVPLADLEQQRTPARHRASSADIAYLQFTSGSSGIPKGLPVTHANLVANTTAIASRLELNGSRDRGVSWLPMYHDMGLVGFLLVPIVSQVPVWYQRVLQFARQPTSWCDLLSRVGGTISYAPTFAYRLIAEIVADDPSPEWDFAPWRIAGCGAEPIHAGTLRRFCDALAQNRFRSSALLPSYGMAEATLAMSMATPAGPMRSVTLAAEALRAGRAEVADPRSDSVEVVSCGRALEHHEIRVADDDGVPLGPGLEGEIQFRGPSVVHGPVTDEVIVHHDWLRTGDLGFILDNEVYVTGRKKDVIIINGRNFHAQEIEWSLASVADLTPGDVVVFGRPVPESGGEELVVALESHPEADFNAFGRRVRECVRSEFAVNAADVVVIERKELLRTTSGKPRRAEMRAKYLAGQLGRSLVGSTI